MAGIFRSFVLSVFLTSFVSGAVFANSLPSWVKEPNSDTHLAIWGFGVADSLQDARNNALSDIAAKFNADVQETIRSHYRQQDNQVSETYEQATQVDVSATTLSHFEFTKTEELKDKIWVQVRLDRPAFAHSLKEKWLHENKVFADKLALLSELSSLEQFVQASELAGKIKRLETLCLQMNYADKRVDVEPSLAFYQSSTKRLSQMMKQAEVILVNKGVPERFESLITEKLSKLGLKVVSSDHKNVAQNISRVELSAKTHVEQDRRSAHNYKIVLDITSFDHEGRIIGKASHQAKGRDYDGEKEASGKALSSMAAMLKRKGLRTLLKLGSESV